MNDVENQIEHQFELYENIIVSNEYFYVETDIYSGVNLFYLLQNSLVIIGQILPFCILNYILATKTSCIDKYSKSYVYLLGNCYIDIIIIIINILMNSIKYYYFIDNNTIRIICENLRHVINIYILVWMYFYIPSIFLQLDKNNNDNIDIMCKITYIYIFNISTITLCYMICVGYTTLKKMIV